MKLIDVYLSRVALLVKVCSRWHHVMVSLKMKLNTMSRLLYL